MSIKLWFYINIKNIWRKVKMKTIGLIGGMSFDSTVEYYKIINFEIRERLGKNSSAKIILHSMNFQDIVDMQFNGEWEKLGDLLADVAVNLQESGADFILICTNLMHKVAQKIEDSVSIPLVHIADVTAQRIKGQNINKVGLLGAVFTMEEDFYKARIEQQGIEVIIPEESDRKEISRIIYEELCRGIFLQSSREKYEQVIEKMIDNGAQGVILGCTEIPLLIKNTSITSFNTTMIHALSAVELALSNN